MKITKQAIAKDERLQQKSWEFIQVLQKKGTFMHELEIAKNFIADNFEPCDIFENETLCDWALANGFEEVEK